MSVIVTRHFATRFGELLIGSLNDELCLCDWRYRRQREAVDARIQRGTGAAFAEGSSPVIEAAVEQLNAYFAGEREAFDLRLRFVGTEFQQRVWNALLAVPYGCTSTYAALTSQVADSTAIRAVASANGANALSIMVPCHRIIGSSGELVGYAGGLPAKMALLRLEGASLKEPEMDLFSVTEEASDPLTR